MSNPYSGSVTSILITHNGEIYLHFCSVIEDFDPILYYPKKGTWFALQVLFKIKILKMKANTKIGLSMMALIAAVSFSSCSVEYRARHPRHKRVIVVGKVSESVPANNEVNLNTVENGVTKN